MSKIFDNIETRFEEGLHAIRPKSIVPIIGEPDIDESYIRQQDVVVLETLLIDRTMTAPNGGTPVNIKWAVDGCAKEYPDRMAAGLPRPKLEETPGFFKVVFERKKKSNEPVNEPVYEPVKMAVVQAIQKTPGIGRPALMRIVGKSRATMTRILSELVAQRLVEHRGSDKTGGYFPVASVHKKTK